MCNEDNIVVNGEENNSESYTTVNNQPEYESLTNYARYNDDGFYILNSNGTWYKVLSYDFKNKIGLLFNEMIDIHSPNGFKNEYIIATSLDLINPYNSGYSWGQGHYYNNLSKAYFDYIDRLINNELPMSDNVMNNVTLTMNEIDFGVTFVSLTDYSSIIKEGQVYTIMNIFAPIYREEDEETDRIFEIGLINDNCEEPVSIGYVKYNELSELISCNELLRFSNKDE